MKATVERVDKMEKGEVRLSELQTGDWFTTRNSEEVRVKTRNGHILLPEASEWEAERCSNFIVIPIKVYLQYEIL